MGRGKHFNHKRKGYKNTKHKFGQNVAAKHKEEAEFAIETVATRKDRPVSIHVEKE
ncbi:hypothetical protein ACSVDA_16120 [Cytobacillus sp. Hm23]